MINKPFSEIGAADITYLVQEAVPEGRTLEYKETLPSNSDNDKKEFLADVSAFANAAGGDLIYGISEHRDENGLSTGIPQTVVGLADVNADAEIRRLDNIIRDGIEPRTAVQIRTIEGLSTEPIIIIRISNSFAAPHMVKFKNTSRFFTRNSAGKHQLDVSEVRAAFAASEALPERIQRFRIERLAKIIANETPVLLPPHPKIVLHVAPTTAFAPQNRIDISHRAKEHSQWLNPLYSNWTDQRYNFDGYLTYTAYTQNDNRGYLQIFRNGILEAVDSRTLAPRNEQLALPVTTIEQYIIEGFSNYLRLLQALEFEPPIIIMLSLLGIKGYAIPVDPFRDEWYPIDRDDLIIPDVLLESYGVHPHIILQPIFDVIWQAGGHPASPNYNEQGNWRWHR